MSGIAFLDALAWGKDATNANNFHFRRPVTPDGTIALWSGAPDTPIEKVLEIDVDGNIVGKGGFNLGDFLDNSMTGTNGWQRLPNGLIIQWGQLQNSASVGAATTVTFPIAFPTNVKTIVMTAANTGTTSSVVWFHGNSATGFSSHGNIANLGAQWLAIGY